MTARATVFRDWTGPAAMILAGAATTWILARDNFQLFHPDAFLGAAFEQPLVSQAVGRIVGRLELLLTDLGVSADLVLYAHWKQTFVLLSLALAGGAHLLRDFTSRPATSTFRYVSALSCALLGGLMAGTAELAHPGMVAFPLAAFLTFLGLNSAWRCAFEREPLVRIAAGLRAILWLGAAGLIASAVLDLDHSEKLTDKSSSLALIVLALLAAGIAVWASVFRLEDGLKAYGAAKGLERAGPGQLGHPARRLGLRVLAALGVAALLAAFGQRGWGMPREVNAADGISPGAIFQDCLHCPNMVAIPAGSFVMGTTQAQVDQLQAAQAWNEDAYGDELPARKVAVSAFALSRTEVTVAEFQTFLTATGYRPGETCWALHNGHLDFHRHKSWRDPGYAQDPEHPVVCVSWRDAQAYVRWLSQNTGESYRLPTEAEWEYAARAGTQAHYSWGDDEMAACAFTNGADEQARLLFPHWQTLACDDGAAFTTPVASFAPNAFGLFDMTGNVWEWVEDCYAPHDPAHTSAAAMTRACSERVIRGGSWSYGTHALRTANRELHHSYTRGSGVGFRIAKTH